MAQLRTSCLLSTTRAANMIHFTIDTTLVFIPSCSVQKQLRLPKRCCSTWNVRYEHNLFCRRRASLPTQHKDVITTKCTPLAMEPSEPSSKYEPSEDDRPEAPSDLPIELSLPQKLLLRRYEQQAEIMTGEDCRQLAVDIARQMMVKDNILKKILKQEVNLGVEMPDPDKWQPPSDDDGE